MAKVKCQECKKEIVGGAKIQEFDMNEPTSMHVFCSEDCRDQWLATTSKEP
ncbi:MAG: hypothetical protein KGD65_11060 [Candidatus Lokiarchaeota archaeon]|nr:hypothetical protein [Candidatus Lokiarchaeota archaeon]